MNTKFQKLQNPEMRNLMTNPEALQAIMQIQQGMQRLQSVAPNSDLLSGCVISFIEKCLTWIIKKYFCLSRLGFPGFPSPMSGSATQPSANPSGTTPTQTSRPATQPPQFNTQSSNYFAQMISMMANNSIVILSPN